MRKERRCEDKSTNWGEKRMRRGGAGSPQHPTGPCLQSQGLCAPHPSWGRERWENNRLASTRAALAERQAGVWFLFFYFLKPHEFTQGTGSRVPSRKGTGMGPPGLGTVSPSLGRTSQDPWNPNVLQALSTYRRGNNFPFSLHPSAAHPTRVRAGEATQCPPTHTPYYRPGN